MKKASDSSTFDTPVLFIIFNRPDITEVVFETIRAAKPPRLYVAADGPRVDKNEEEVCRKTRMVVEQVDWDCEVHTLFRDENIGCGLGVSQAINWFFEHEEMGIILEDDCVGTPSFFRFCQEMLEYYRDDSRVMHIGGCNFQSGWVRDSDYSYYFSHYGHNWGWATWRRAWNMYDYTVQNYGEIRKKGYLNGYFDHTLARKYRLSKIDKIFDGKEVIPSWDYQWGYTKFVNNGLAIVPNKNLVSNIGFGDNATHTLSAQDVRANNKSYDLNFPIKHPQFMVRDVKSDRRYFFKYLFLNVILKRKILGKLGIGGFSSQG